GDQPVAALRDRLDVSRVFRRVAQRLAQLDDDLGERVVGHDDARPGGGEQRFAAHHVPPPVGQIDEHRHGLGLELDGLASGRELVQRRIDRPVADPQRARRRGGKRFSVQRVELCGVPIPSPKLSRLFGTFGPDPAFNEAAVPYQNGGDMKISRTLIGVLLPGLFIQATFAHDDPKQAAGLPPEELGKVSFPTSCDPKVQARFERGVALLHSFWFPEGRKAFLEVLEADPSCSIAYWGLGVNRLLNPFGGQPTEKVLLEGQAAVDKGLAAPAKTQRERGYLEAIAAFYPHDRAPWRERALKYEKAMEQLAARYPQDSEAAIFYALALNIAADLSDRTYSRQLKAAALLEPIFA